MPLPVVLVHGLRTSSSLWRGQVEALRSRGHAVATPDLPGHGARMGERFSLDGAMDAIGSAVASVSTAGSPVFLAGFSLGGYLSVHYAARHGAGLAGLLAASCGTQPGRVVLDGWRVGAAAIRRLPDRGLALNNAAVRLAVRDPALAHDVISGGVALDVMDDVLRELRAIRMTESLAAIDLPVWLVNGSLDHFRLQERSFLRATRHGTLVHIAGATHMVSVVRPVAFTTVLVEAVNSAGR